MVFLRDDGDSFDVPIDVVWRFLGSGAPHERAHRHRRVRRRVLAEDRGEYAWEQSFDGAPTRFTMRWAAFPPVGIAYEVLVGPFEGSRFFLYYTPRGHHTDVAIVGEFVSPSLPEEDLPAAVRRFFDTEFEQDRQALREYLENSGR